MIKDNIMNIHLSPGIHQAELPLLLAMGKVFVQLFLQEYVEVENRETNEVTSEFLFCFALLFLQLGDTDS